MLALTDRGLRVGLALALMATGPGCSRLKGARRDDPAPVIGAIRDADDPHNRLAATVAAKPPAPESIALGPPIAAEPAPEIVAPAPIPASTGVPDAARLIAAGTRTVPAPSAPDGTKVIAAARARLDAMASYQVSMHRQERVNGALQPEEDVILAIRRQPRAVRLTWPSGPNQGREVLYRADEPGGQMHVNMPNSALMPRISIAPDSPMVMRNSRHPITEAGFDSILSGLEAAARAPGRVIDAGMATSEALDHPHRLLTQSSTDGESWRVFFDPETRLPALVEGLGPDGSLLERYRFRDLRADLPELAEAAAFDPDARWGAPRGLFGRLGQGSASTPR